MSRLAAGGLAVCWLRELPICTRALQVRIGDGRPRLVWWMRHRWSVGVVHWCGIATHIHLGCVCLTIPRAHW